MKFFLLAAGLLLHLAAARCQAPADRIEIGDDISQMIFPRAVGYPKNTVTIGDFRGKVVILDFWSTWCAPCFKQFGTTIDLQNKHKDDVVILTVNTYLNDDEAAVKKAIGRWEKGQNRKFTLPIALYDSANLRRLMPTGMPHYMWIDRKGIFRGAGRDDSFTESTIQSAIAGDFSGIRQTRRVFFNLDSHLLAENPFPVDSIIYSSVLGGYNRDIPAVVGLQHDTAGRPIGLVVANCTLPSLYKVTDSLIDRLPENRFYGGGIDLKRLYSYQLWYKNQSIERLQRLMRNEIDRLLQVQSGWQIRDTDCWVLSVTDQRKLPLNRQKPYYGLDDETADTAYSYGGDLDLLVAFLNGRSPITIVNESDYTGKLDLALPNGLSVEGMAGYLKRYGISLVRSKRPLQVFVIHRY
ncbi:MAG: TlpA disulfide reductase family protein [Flavihumibacter sp.]